MVLPLVIGHRGVVEYAPENSISGIEIAKLLKLDGIEIDARLSKDNKAIVFHDETFDRCTLANGYVNKTKYKSLLKFDISNYMKPSISTFDNEKIPLLNDALKLCYNSSMYVIIDIKTEKGDIKSPKIICQNIKKNGNYNTTIVSSFDYKTLEIARYIIPEFNRMLIVENIPLNWKYILQKYGCYGIVVSIEHNTFDTIISLANNGYVIYVYTVNDKDTAEYLNNHGIGVITDFPYSLLKYK